MTKGVYIFLVLTICTALTFFTRALPFLIWGGDKEVPKSVQFLGKFLPMAVMGTLVIYCVRGVAGLGELTAQIVSIALVAGTYVYKRNTFISIALGTLCFMVFTQLLL